jgi:hypothetical protein
MLGDDAIAISLPPSLGRVNILAVDRDVPASSDKMKADRHLLNHARSTHTYCDRSQST